MQLDKFTEKAQAAVVAAQQLAERLQSPVLDAEHLLSALLEPDDGVPAETLRRLGGVEDQFFLAIGNDRVAGIPEGDEERTREDGKTSAVHFLRFPLGAAQIAVFRDPATSIMVGCAHQQYSHLAGLTPATRAELARDFA